MLIQQQHWQHFQKLNSTTLITTTTTTTTSTKKQKWNRSELFAVLMMIWVRLWQLAHILWPRFNIIRIVICIFRFWKLACIVWQGTSSQNQNSYLDLSVCQCWPSINTLLSKIKQCMIHFYKSKASELNAKDSLFSFHIFHQTFKMEIVTQASVNAFVSLLI